MNVDDDVISHTVDCNRSFNDQTQALRVCLKTQA